MLERVCTLVYNLLFKNFNSSKKKSRDQIKFSYVVEYLEKKTFTDPKGSLSHFIDTNEIKAKRAQGCNRRPLPSMCTDSLSFFGQESEGDRLIQHFFFYFLFSCCFLLLYFIIELAQNLNY